MPSAQEFLNSTLRLIGVLASGESPSVSESDDALSALNQMLAGWSMQQAPVYELKMQPVDLNGSEAYILDERPARIKTAVSWTSLGVQKGVSIVDSNGWAGVADRTRTGAFAESLFYDGGFPQGTVYISPKPSSGKLELWCYMPLTEVASLGAQINFPPGYEHTIRFALAEVLASEYGMPLSDAVARQVAEAKSGMAQLNAQVLGAPAPAAAA